MGWTESLYLKSEINKAGRLLSIKSDYASERDIDLSMNILSNFRTAHGYPLNIFTKRLRRIAKKIDSRAIVFYRLKRIPAILYKLNRSYEGRRPTMKLYDINDIGGCRAVVSDVYLARVLWEKNYVKNTNMKHEKLKPYDYVENPKVDGYRGFHISYIYKSDKGKSNYDGLRIEIQIRSKLQHLWATAVETVDFFTGQAIKTNEGKLEWVEFFRLVSSAIAIKERSPYVPGTPTNRNELYSLIKEKEKELNAIEKMISWRHVRDFLNNQIKDKLKASTPYFFLLELDIFAKKLAISTYDLKNEKLANENYLRLEKLYGGNSNYDVVLVSIDNKDDLKNAYPNYFADVDGFIDLVKGIISEIIED